MTPFPEAVAAIDAGDVERLRALLDAHPALARDRFESFETPHDFFRSPYLLWFVAEDPVRNDSLPANIADVARTIVAAAQGARVASLQEQLDYALRLVSWSWVARRCGVQADLIEVLLDGGARTPETITHDALINGNFVGARRLVERGAPLTLATALCLDRWEDADRLAATATGRDRQVALVLCALNGRPEALRRLLALGIDLDAYSTDIYSHATAVHHAVCSGSLEAVRVLVEAGADLSIKDRAWDGTPLDWADYYIREAKEDDGGKAYPEIAAYLRTRPSPRPPRAT